MSATTIFMSATLLAVAAVAAFVTPRADATNPTCGSIGFTLAPLHGTRFYVDSSSSPVLDSGYTGVSISPSAAKTNVWVKLSGFAGGALSLNANQPSAFPLGNLASGSTTPAYFFLTASPVADNATAQTFGVDVYQGDPSHGGSLLCSYADGYSAGVYDTIQASANKVQDVTGDSVAASVSTSSPVIGGTITLTVEGTTGTLGSGPDGTPFIYETPTSLGSWPAGSFRLTGTTLTLSPGASQTVYTNQLQIANSSFSSAQSYIAQYTFQITGTTSAATTPYPIQEISSGTQVKHTNTSSLASIPAIQPASNTMTLSSTASTASLPSSGGTVTYTVKLHSTSSTSTAIDEVVDTLPANATYQAGTAKLDGSTIGDPTSSSGTLVFPGPFGLSSSADRTLTFDVTLPATGGTYTNSVVGYVASTQIDTTTSTSDSAPATASTTVAGAAQTITFAQPADTRVDQGPVALSASASSGLAVSFASSTTGVCTVSGSSVTLVSTGTCTITASQAGNASYAAATPVSRSFQVTAAPLAQTITFAQPADTRVDQGPVTLSVSASSGLAVSFASSTTGVCTVSGSSVTLVSTGTCTITASQPGNGTYAAATPVSRSFQVTAAPLAQTITFAQPSDTRLDQGPVSLSASASSGLTVAFESSTTAVCTVSGSSVALVSTGTCTITASQAGNGTYAAATPVSRSFQVSAAPLPQSITFAQPADTRVDQGPVALSASASSGLTVSFASSTTSVCSVSGSTVTLVSVGTCTITAAQAGDASYAAATSVSRSFAVTAAPGAQTITFAQPADTRVDQGPVALSASASSGLAVSFASSTTSVCTVSGSSVTLVSTGTCTIAASQAGTVSYAAATDVTRSFQVIGAPSSQSITFAQPSDTRVDQDPVSLGATASSGLPVSYASSTTGVCTVSAASVTLVSTGTCTIVASQAGDSTYAPAADVTKSFQVTALPAAPTPQSITFPQPSDTRVDQSPVSLGATASSGLTVSYASSTSGVCTVSGSSVTLVSTGTCTIVASQAGDSTFAAAADVTVSFQVTIVSPPIATPTAQAITFLQPADTQVDQGPVTPGATASSGLAVTYSSSTTGVCTVSGASVALVATGTCTITASQPGDATYAAASDVTKSFQVTAASTPAPVATPTAQAITFPQPADTQVDQGPVSLGATASSGLAVSYGSATTTVCTLSGASVTLVTVGTCTITASQPGDSTYAAASDVTKSFEVTSAPTQPAAPVVTPTAQAITFPQPADTRVDRGPVALLATASSGLAVAYASSTAGTCTVSGSSVTLLSTGTCTITASQPGDSTYAAATDVSRSFTVTAMPSAPPTPAPVPAPAPAPPAGGPKPQAIVFAPIPATGLGAGPIELGAAASSGLGISYESQTPSICTVSASGAVTVVGTGICTIVAHQAGNDRWSPAPDSRQSFGVTAPPLPAPTTVPATTTAGRTTQSRLGGIATTATVAVDGAPHLAGVAAVHVEGAHVVVTPTKSFSGIVNVPIVVTDGGRSVQTTVVVVVRPAAPTAIAVTPKSNTDTAIAWKPSASATGYVVRVDGRVVCRTTGNACDVPTLVAPNAHVVVTATGNAGTRSDDAPAAYAPDKPVLIAVVHFASDSSQLATTARNILDATESKIAKGGYTHAMLTCHTDSAGSLVYNMALSAGRCGAVAAYVKRELGIAHVTYRQAAFAYLRPAAPNATPRGMAKNRRVEVYVK